MTCAAAQKVMHLVTNEFIRHILIRTTSIAPAYGLLATATRKTNTAKAHALLGAEELPGEAHPRSRTSPNDQLT